MGAKESKLDSGIRELAEQCEDVLRLAQAVEPNLHEIAERARRSQLLTERFLQAVNSVGMGLQHPVSDVQHALALLGTRRVARIVQDVLHSMPAPPHALPHPSNARPLHGRTGSQNAQTES